MSLGCIAVPIHGCKYFGGIRICPTHFLAPRDHWGLEEWPKTGISTSTTRSTWQAPTSTSRWRREGLIPLSGGALLLPAPLAGREGLDRASLYQFSFPPVINWDKWRTSHCLWGKVRGLNPPNPGQWLGTPPMLSGWEGGCAWYFSWWWPGITKGGHPTKDHCWPPTPWATPAPSYQGIWREQR